MVTVTEAENFKAGEEARADVLSRAGRHPGGLADAVQHMVDAAFYRETHRAVPKESTEDTESG